MDERTLPAGSNRLDRRQERQVPAEPHATFELLGMHKGLKRLREWVAENGALYLTLKDAAEVACLEPHYLSRAFRRHVGQTFLQWTRDYRIIHAVRAIESGLYPIDRVVKLVGYRDRRSLERAIKRATGITPAALLRNRQLMSQSR